MKTKYILFPFLVLPIFALANNNFTMNSNPLLSKFDTPFQTIPFDFIKPEHFKPAFDTAFKNANNRIAAITKNPEEATFENTIVALEYSSQDVDRVSQILFNLNYAETSPEIQALAKEVAPLLTDFQNDITLNPILFARVKKVYDDVDRKNLTTEQAELLNKTYKAFVRSGANLSDNAKERYRAVTKETSELSVVFNENVLAETNAFILHITDPADLAGLPEDVVSAATEEAANRKLTGWVFTLQYPSYVPFMKNANNRELRKKILTASARRAMNGNANDNTEIIKKLTALRLEEANLLGFPTYAAFMLDNRMAETSERVNSFLKELSDAYLPAAKNEVAEVREYAKTLGADFELQRWDWSYYSEKLKEEKYTINDELIRPYFELERVQKGVFDLAGRLYGLTFKPNDRIQVYNKDVKAFEVYDENNKFLAILYMDFFPRETKKDGAWMTEFIQQHKENGVDIRPQVSLVFNFTKPTGDKPSLISYDEVQTMLHEFGHALHGMLSEVTYASLAGTSVYRDFVELPSQIMENWSEQRDWLDGVAIHYKTGEKMPDTLLQKIMDSKNYNEAYFGTRQLSYGLVDMAWYTITKPFEGDIEAFEKKAMEPVEVMPPLVGTAMSPAFSHIFSGGYSAGYYSYKWAEVLDADAFSVFLEKGIYDKETAARFRQCILSKGGTEHPMKLFIDFRGREPSTDALLKRSGLKK
jgi:peptidyl-dipeptidase Dcp